GPAAVPAGRRGAARRPGGRGVGRAEPRPPAGGVLPPGVARAARRRRGVQRPGVGTGHRPGRPPRPRIRPAAGRGGRLLDPRPAHLNTLGVVYYRLGRWEDAAATLTRAAEANNQATAFEDFFLAMCHR